MNARARLAQLRATLRDGTNRIRDHYAASSGALISHLAEARAMTTDLGRRIRDLARAGRPEEYDHWDSVRWDDWHPASRLPAELRIGRTSVGGFDDLPATVPVFTGRIVILTSEDESAARHAHDVLRGLAVRFAAAMGRDIVLHFIDPFREGHGFPERPLLPGVAARSIDAVADLKAAFEAAHADSQGDGNPRRHVVFAMDYPRGFSHQAVQYLDRIPRLHNAQLIIHHDLTAAAPASTDLQVTRPVVVDVRDDGTATGCWGRLEAGIDAPPPASLTARIAEALPQRRIVNLGWGDVNPTDPATWWGGEARGAAVARIGADVHDNPIDLVMGINPEGQSRTHMVIGGTPGSGKSVLLHVIITSLAARYSPDEVQFILIDGRDGAEMKSYRRLPHAQAVAIHTPRELAEGVIRDVQAELVRRNGLFASRNVQNINQLPNAARGGLARLVVVIDEYQAYLQDHRGDIEKVLWDIVSRGRAVGIHLVLASQRFHASGMTNREALFANVDTRVSLRMAQDTITNIAEFDQAGRRLILEHCEKAGDVVVNTNLGEAPHVAGRVGFLPGDELTRIIDALAARGDGRTPLVLDGQQAPEAAENPALKGLARIPRGEAVTSWATWPAAEGGLGAASWPSHENPAAFVAGRTMTIHGTAHAVIRRAAKQNVAVICEHPEVLVGVMQTGIATWSRTTQPAGFSLWLLSRLPARAGDPWRGALTDQLQRLLACDGHGFRQATNGARAAELVAEATALLETRVAMDVDALADEDTVVLAAAGLERLREFQSTEGRFGPEPAEAATALKRLTETGPAYGIHVVCATTSRAAWNQVWPDKQMNQFTHRFYGQLSETDSHALLGDQQGHRVDSDDLIAGPARMGYGDATAGVAIRFLPYVAGPGLGGALTNLGRS